LNIIFELLPCLSYGVWEGESYNFALFCFKQFDNSKELITPVENSDNRQNLKKIKHRLCLPANREGTEPRVPSV